MSVRGGSDPDRLARLLVAGVLWSIGAATLALGAHQLLPSPSLPAAAEAGDPMHRLEEDNAGRQAEAGSSCPEDADVGSFTDVAPSNPYSAAVSCARFWEIMYGTSSTTYTPHGLLDQQQLGWILSRLVAQAQCPLPAENGRDAVESLVAAGVVTDGGTAPPESRLVTRLELAGSLVRAYDYCAERQGLATVGTGLPLPQDPAGPLDDEVDAAARNGLLLLAGDDRGERVVRRDEAAGLVDLVLTHATEAGMLRPRQA